ncbi:MAG: 2-C-methyl-D-erythritol 4-phosphate cytidylyltransferase [Bacteroidota bacterium]
MEKFALIVGGGQGLRFGGEVPKQFQLLDGRPVLFRSIDLFSAIADRVVMVIPQSQFEYFQSLVQQFGLPIIPEKFQLVAGGSTRTESVANGLNALSGDGVVAIHDAVRPLATTQLVQSSFQEAAIHGSAIPVIPVRDSLRKKTDAGTVAVDREQYLAVQTPQCFDFTRLMNAYREQAGNFTDDASLFESTGGKVHLVEGENSNIKITWPEDLLFAEAILKSRN